MSEGIKENISGGEKEYTVEDIKNQIKPLSNNSFVKFFQKILRWWLGVWYGFCDKKPKFSALVYKVFFFIVFSMGVTIWQFIIMAIVPEFLPKTEAVGWPMVAIPAAGGRNFMEIPPSERPDGHALHPLAASLPVRQGQPAFPERPDASLPACLNRGRTAIPLCAVPALSVRNRHPAVVRFPPVDHKGRPARHATLISSPLRSPN